MRRTQLERRTETQALVLKQAYELFGEKGYANTSLEDIAQACGLTIRPVYHYFGNKKNLFMAVNEKLENDLITAIEKAMQRQNQSATQAGWQAFLSMSSNRNFRQIVLVDSPTILGRERWATNVVILRVRAMLLQLYPKLSAEKGELITRMLIASLAEAALMTAEMENPAIIMQEVGKLIEGFLQLASKE